MVVSKKNKSIKKLQNNRLHINKKKGTKIYYNYKKRTLKGGSSSTVKVNDQFSIIDIVNTLDTEPLLHSLLETFVIKVTSTEKSLKIFLINKEWVKKIISLSQEKFGWLLKFGGKIAQIMANTILFIFNFDNNNNITTKIVSPIGIMQINSDGTLKLLGVKSWVIKQFISNEIYKQIDEQIKANYPLFIQSIK